MKQRTASIFRYVCALVLSYSFFFLFFDQFKRMKHCGIYSFVIKNVPITLKDNLFCLIRPIVKSDEICVQVQHANKVVNSQGSTVIWKLKSHGTVIKGEIVTEVESMLVGKGNVEQVDCMLKATCLKFIANPTNLGALVYVHEVANYRSLSMPSACLSEKCILLLRHIAPSLENNFVSVCDRKQALAACISHGAVAKLLVSGQQYTLGFTAIAIHFQAVTNFVPFLYQIFILPVQELLKAFPSVEVTLLKSTVIQTKKVDDLIEAGANLRAKLGLHPRTSNK
ncbi:S-adenosyl-L-methionine-dependent methyltransferase superfamily protein [Trifolium repens]|nr:S-adenosyl-L-methionine-dependent methyltransferase superfamily protein [Trifolium repens]